MKNTYGSQNGTNGFANVRGWNEPDTFSSRPPQNINGKFESRPARTPIKNKILKSIPEKTLDHLLSSMMPVYLESNEYIYQPDEDIHFLYFPETAVFSEFQILRSGKITEIMMTGREGVIGIHSMLNSHPAPNLTQVLQGGQALRVDTISLKRKLNDNREIKATVLEYVNQLINQITQRVVCNGFHSIEERLCTWLLMVHDRSGRAIIKITHEQIAMSLGVHRPSVTQITKVLRNEQIVDYERGRITIVNRPKLQFRACDCYASVN